MRAYASMMVCIYPLGVPALYVLLLASERRFINPLPGGTNTEAIEVRNANSERISHLEFLYGLYWWVGFWTQHILLTELPLQSQRRSRLRPSSLHPTPGRATT